MGETTSTSVNPFLRWAGGKQWLAHRLAKLVPKEGCAYFEPFLGGGSLFFTTLPKQAILGDINQELIETYQVVSIKCFEKGKIKILIP